MVVCVQQVSKWANEWTDVQTNSHTHDRHLFVCSLRYQSQCLWQTHTLTYTPHSVQVWNCLICMITQLTKVQEPRNTKTIMNTVEQQRERIRTRERQKQHQSQLQHIVYIVYTVLRASIILDFVFLADPVYFFFNSFHWMSLLYAVSESLCVCVCVCARALGVGAGVSVYSITTHLNALI